MAFLRQFQVSDNASLAEEILNEVSRARLTLLNADKKTAYDADLQQRMADQTAALKFASLPIDFDDSSLPHAESIASPMLPGGRKDEPAGKLHPRRALLVAVVAAFVNPGGDGSPNKDTTNTVAEHSETPDKPNRPVAAESPKIPAKQSLTASPRRILPTTRPPSQRPRRQRLLPKQQSLHHRNGKSCIPRPGVEVTPRRTGISSSGPKVERRTVGRWQPLSRMLTLPRARALDLHKWVWASSGFLRRTQPQAGRKRLQNASAKTVGSR